MATLADLLAVTPAHSLRAMATFLGVRQRGQARKHEWIAAILHHWQQVGAFAALPPAVQSAYHHLHTAGQLPSTLFWQEYGALRLPGDETAPLPPWQAPQSSSEVLYYSGLLYPVGHRQIRKAPWVTTPTDLPLAAASGSEPPSCLADHPVETPWFLLHDVAQYLIYCQQPPGAAPLHGYWLAHHHLHALNQRLLRPAPAPLPRSHKATPALALLTYLALAAGLVDSVGITAVGWQWLAASPSDQLRALWRGWVQAPMPLRIRHAQPDALLPAPWPQPLLQWLGQQVAPFSAQQAAARLLGSQPALADYFVAHLTAVSDLAARLAPLFAFDLCQLGLLQPAEASPAALNVAQHHDPQRRYRLSAIGAWLLHAAAPAPFFPAVRNWSAGTTAPPLCLPGLLTVPIDLPFTVQAQLAAYADYQPQANAAAGRQHVYEFTSATIARAAAQGQPLAVLVDTLAALHHKPDVSQMRWLQQAYTDGCAFQLAYLPLLRSDSTARLAALQQDQRLADLLGELLGPTTVTLQSSLIDAYSRLTQAGYVVMTPTPLPPAPSADEADDPAAIPSPALLWLAGRLYQALGEHLPTLPPLPGALLARLGAALDPATQAVVQSQFQAMHGALLQLLDGYHLMPPTLPPLSANDNTAIRQQLQQAIAVKQLVQIHYYTAGRNLLTVRIVEPYWLEERHGIPYLRAYCHSAGAVLTFRLDRIEALVQGP